MGLLIDRAQVTQLFTHTIQERPSDILVSDLATAEQYGEFDFRPGLQEFASLTRLRIKVVIVDLRSQTHFLQRGRTLTPSRFALAATLLVSVFAVIHQPADRRSGIRLYFYKVVPALARQIQRFTRPDYPNVLALFIDKANLRYSNSLIYPSGSGCANRSLPEKQYRAAAVRSKPAAASTLDHPEF
jgi:hypothetical protein